MTGPATERDDALPAASGQVDCERGRAMGCRTFCCRLIVRLEPGEVAPFGSAQERKHCVDKDPRTGWCVHLNTQTQRCTVWERRPRVCHDYDCNTDPLLQVVLRHGFVDLTTLVKTRLPVGASKLLVPYRERE